MKSFKRKLNAVKKIIREKLGLRGKPVVFGIRELQSAFSQGIIDRKKLLDFNKLSKKDKDKVLKAVENPSQRNYIMREAARIKMKK